MIEDSSHGRKPVDTSNCGPDCDVCVRDLASGEISWCAWHYENIMAEADAHSNFPYSGV